MDKWKGNDLSALAIMMFEQPTTTSGMLYIYDPDVIVLPHCSFRTLLPSSVISAYIG